VTDAPPADAGHAPRGRERAWLVTILCVGLLLRVVVFFFLDPLNNDGHYYVVRYIRLLYALPPANTAVPTDNGTIYLAQAYHPPLYYLLAVPWDAVFGAKGVQLFSTLLSVANLLVLYRLIVGLPLITSAAVRVACVAFVALLPQFVIFGSFISNDTLSYLIGSLIAWQSWRYIVRPSPPRLLALAALLGAGLLTKGTFLAYVPPLLALVLLVELRGRQSRTRATKRVIAFILLAGALGCYKFVENQVNFGRPIVHNLDFDYDWIPPQKGTWQGPRTLLDVKVWKLVRSPRLSSATRHSYPLLLYGTFWYSHIRESNFQSPASAAYVAPFIYLFAIVPTLLMLIGWWRIIASRTADEERIFCITCAALLAFNLAIVIAAGVKYDVWSCFQGRMLFPSMFPIILALAAGLELATRTRAQSSPSPGNPGEGPGGGPTRAPRGLAPTPVLPRRTGGERSGAAASRSSRILRALVWLDMMALFIAFAAYFAVEIARPLPGAMPPR
jgi:4-amino-4-deoxy-L-arabinose transferase-like glycosyltransferase